MRACTHECEAVPTRMRTPCNRRRRLCAVVAAPLGIDHPAARQVRVDAVGHDQRSDRHTRRAACRDDLCLELGAVFASASAASADFVGNIVHVSSKNQVDTRLLQALPALQASIVDGPCCPSESHASPAARVQGIASQAPHASSRGQLCTGVHSQDCTCRTQFGVQTSGTTANWHVDAQRPKCLYL